MTDRDLRRAVAEKVLGCRIVDDSDGVPTCGCVGLPHGYVNNPKGLTVFWRSEAWVMFVAREAHRRFGLVVGAHEDPRAICEKAVAAAEAWERDRGKTFSEKCPPDTSRKKTAVMLISGDATVESRVAKLENHTRLSWGPTIEDRLADLEASVRAMQESLDRMEGK
jgi:hypothetical protein